MSKDSFKKFVRNNPNLINYVKENNSTWQQLYETYELYGEDNNIWKNYIKENKITNSFNEIITTIKNIDLDKLQNGIESIQNTISLIQNFATPKQNNQYEPKYNYKHLDD